MREKVGARVAAIVIGAVEVSAVSGNYALASTTHGKVFFNGQVVGTVVTPAAVPGGGTDPFYEVSGGVAGQLGIAGDGPCSGSQRAPHAASRPARQSPAAPGTGCPDTRGEGAHTTLPVIRARFV